MQIVNPLNIENWDELLEDLDGATIFHSSAWAKVLAETYRYDPKYFVSFNGDRLSALLPLMEIRSIFTGTRAVSLPFTDFSPPLFEDKEGFTGLMEEAVNYGGEAGWRRIEIRGLMPGNLKGEAAVEYFTHDLDLSRDLNHIKSDIRNSVLRNIKKAVREGVAVEKVNSLEGIKNYYKLNRLTRKRHGFPSQPFSFFASVHDNIIAKGLGNLFLAHYRGKCVAGAVFFHFKDQALFKFGASDMRYHNLRINNMIMWEAIKNYANGAYRSLSFGRTDLDNSGLRQFKKGWGTTESRVGYYSYHLDSQTFVSDDILVKNWQKKILSRTPTPVLELFGSILYKHIG